VWALAWFAGERTRLRRQQLDEFEHRAIRAEHEAMQERRRTALETIESVAHRTVAEKHGVAGLPVTVATSGRRRPLGGAADRAAFRILQEALTNSARHGAGGAQVELSDGERALELTVSNAVRPDSPAS
jgi:hypothetical protein